MKSMHSYGWLDQPPFLFGSAKNIDHLDVCFIGASAQSHNCSVNDVCKCTHYCTLQGASSPVSYFETQ